MPVYVVSDRRVPRYKLNIILWEELYFKKPISKWTVTIDFCRQNSIGIKQEATLSTFIKTAKDAQRF